MDLTDKHEQDVMKGLPIIMVAERLGLRRAGVEDRNNIGFFMGDIKVIISPQKNVWNSFRLGKGGSTIDLVMLAEGCNFGTAKKWLREQFLSSSKPDSFPAAQQCINRVAASNPDPADAEGPPVIHTDESVWSQVRQYLIYERGIKQALIDWLHSEGKIGAELFVDKSGLEHVNVVFNREGGGAFKRGIRSQYKGAVGRAEQGCGAFVIHGAGFGFDIGGLAGLVAIVESPIDSISYYQLNPEITVAATGGNCTPVEALKSLLNGQGVIAAQDADKAGDKQAAALMAVYPNTWRSPPPSFKDWNEYLCKYVNSEKVQI